MKNMIQFLVLATFSSMYGSIGYVPTQVIKPRIGIIISIPQFTELDIKNGVDKGVRDQISSIIKIAQASDTPLLELKKIGEIKTKSNAIDNLFKNMSEVIDEIISRIRQKDAAKIKPFIGSLHEHAKNLEIKAHAGNNVPLATKTKLTELRKALDNALVIKAQDLQLEIDNLLKQGKAEEASALHEISKNLIEEIKNINQKAQDLYNALETTKGVLPVLQPGKSYQPIPSKNPINQ